MSTDENTDGHRWALIAKGEYAPPSFPACPQMGQGRFSPHWGEMSAGQRGEWGFYTLWMSTFSGVISTDQYPKSSILYST